MAGPYDGAARSMAAVSALLLLLLVVSVTEAATGSTVVAGMVFGDQCKDSARGLFDYPLYGARVAIQCGGGDAPITVRECNTNWFGGFSVLMEGSPDMNRCTACVVHATGHCSSGANAEPRELTHTLRMLGLALYTVMPLLSQPDQPMDFCPRVSPVPPHDPTAAAAMPSPPAPPLTVAPAPMSSPVPIFWRRRPRLLPPVWRRPPTVPQQPEPETLPSAPAPSSSETPAEGLGLARRACTTSGRCRRLRARMAWEGAQASRL